MINIERLYVMSLFIIWFQAGCKRYYENDKPRDLLYSLSGQCSEYPRTAYGVGLLGIAMNILKTSNACMGTEDWIYHISNRVY